MKPWRALVLLLFAGSASAEGKTDPVLFPATARIALDAEGVPQDVQANPKLPVPVREAIERRVKQWRFEPALVDGVARPSSPTRTSRSMFAWAPDCIAAGG